MVIVGGVGAVVVRCHVMGAGIVDRHGQLVVFRVVRTATARVGDVDHADLVGTIRRCGEGIAIGNRHERGAVERVRHGDAPGRQVVVQVEGFTLLQIDGDQVFIVGIVSGNSPQITADHQQRGHGGRVSGKGGAHVRQVLVGGIIVVGAGEVDGPGAGKVSALSYPAGVEGRWCSRQQIAIGIAVVRQQQLARYHDAARQHVGNDVVIPRHWRQVRHDIDRQRGSGEVAIVVTDREADTLGDLHRRGLLRGVGVITRVEVDHQGTALGRSDADAVVDRVEGPAVGTAEGQRTGVGIALGVVGVGGPIDHDGFDKAAIGAEGTALAQQCAGDRRADHRARKHRVELHQVGHDHCTGVGVDSTVVRQWIEVGVTHPSAQADGVVVDVIGV
ncbi:hypothetical protein D3C85_958590 [compost metagenome]